MARLAGGRSHIGFQNSWYYDSAAHRTSSPRLEDSITVDVGGTDHVFLGGSTDTVTVADTGFGANDKVTVHDIGSGDKIIYGGTEHSLAASTNMVEITESGITEFTI